MSEDRPGDDGDAPPARLSQLRAAVEAAAPADEFDTLCRCCLSEFDATGAAASLILGHSYGGRLGASDDSAGRIEDEQFTLGEGPAMDADRRNELVEARWPALSISRVWSGVCSVITAPLRAGAAQFGTLSLHRSSPTGWDRADLLGLSATAQMATEWILARLAGMQDARLDPAFAATADNRAIVHQAAGVLSVRMDASVADALVALRAHSFATGYPLHVVAAGVVDGTFELGRRT